MADTTYNVRTVYSTNTAGAVSALDRLGSMFDRLGGLLGGLKSLLFGLPSLIVAAFATGAVAAFMQRVMSVGGAAETARLSMAGMINAQMFATPTKAAGDFAQAMFASNALIERGRTLMARYPGTDQDLGNVQQLALSGGISAGRSLLEIQDLSARLVGVTQGLGVDSAQAGRDLSLMLAGRAGQQVLTFSKLSALIGKTAEQFNQMSGPERWQAIDRALAGFNPMLEAAAHSWDGISSTAMSYGASLLRVGTAPLFERAKGALFELNTWIEHNRASLQALAQIAGTGLADAFGRAVDTMKALPGLLTRVGSSPGFARLWGLGERLQASAAGALSGPGPSRDAVGAGVGVAAGLGTGIPGLGLVVGALLAFATHTAAADSVLSSLSSSGGSLFGALGTLWVMVTLLDGELGHLLAAVLPGIGRGIALLMSGIDDALKIVAPALGEMLVAFRPVLGVLAEIIGGLAGFLGGTLKAALVSASEQIAAFARATAGVVRSMGSWLAQHGITLESVRNAGDWVGRNINAPVAGFLGGSIAQTFQELAALNRGFGSYVLTGESGNQQTDGWMANYRRFRDGYNRTAADSDPRNAPPPVAGAPPPDPMARLNEWIAGFGTAATRSTANTEAQLAALNARLARGGTPTHTTNVTNHVQVHQTIEQADDPDRVLLATRDAVIDAMLHPVESTSVTVTR